MNTQKEKVKKPKDPIRNRWNHMNERCYKTDYFQYPNYGGRGIGVCEEWRKDFQKFKEWSLANGYSKELEIGRIDIDKDYSPENCRYVTPETQCNNRRNNRVETYQGVTASMADLCRMFGKDYNLVRRRMCHGKTIEEAMDADRARPFSGAIIMPIQEKPSRVAQQSQK